MAKRNSVIPSFTFSVDGWNTRIDPVKASPCPFCWGKAVLVVYGPDFKETGKRLHRVMCSRCGATQPLVEHCDAAIASWQDRVEFPTLEICHRCRNREHLTAVSDMDYGQEELLYEIHCDRCGISGPGCKTQIEAAKAWNKRERKLYGKAE